VEHVTPRLALTYAVRASRKTIVRGMLRDVRSQLRETSEVRVAHQYSYGNTNAVDRNGDGSRRSVNPVQQGARSSSGFDPTNPTRLSTVKPSTNEGPITHELVDRDGSE